MKIPSFRNDFEVERFAQHNKPYAHAFGPIDLSYAQRYGARAAEAATKCREAALNGDMKGLQHHTRALSSILATDCPELFGFNPRPARRRAA